MPDPTQAELWTDPDSVPANGTPDGVALIDGLRQDGHSKRVLREPCAARAGARA